MLKILVGSFHYGAKMKDKIDSACVGKNWISTNARQRGNGVERTSMIVSNSVVGLGWGVTFQKYLSFFEIEITKKQNRKSQYWPLPSLESR